LIKKCEIGTLPVTKSLPSYMYTYVLVKLYLYLYLYLYTVPTNLPSSTYLPTYSILHGQEEESRIMYSTFSSPPRVFHQLSFFTYLAFFMDAFYWFLY